MQLSELMEFTLGKNPTRVKGEPLYSPDDFESDLHSGREEVPQGCIINLIKSKAAPKSNQSAGKCVTSNFLQLTFDNKRLDPWYFCYSFNEGSLSQKVGMYNQGTTTSVKKLNTKTIGEMEMDLPDIGKQHAIGQIYRQAIVQNDLLIKKAEITKKTILTILQKMEEE